jgi:DNA polymerase-3 subunit gamma/tau
MSYQVLARRWRPRTFPEVVGQTHVVRALANALDSQRVHHAFLFTGTRGVGKTTLARILARCLNCEQGVSSRPCGVCGACRELDEGRFVDLIEVDAASRTKVEDTRDLLENVPYAPTRGRYKVYLIDEVHMLSAHSFNALLKTLEEPPPHVKFLLATTEPQRLPATILSRCLQFSLKRVPAASIAEHLGRVTEAEGIPAEAGALSALAAAADGSVRDALSLLDQAVAFGGGALREVDVQEMLGTLDRAAVLGVLTALADGDGSEALARARAIADRAVDLGAVIGDLATWLHRLAVLQVVGEPDSQGGEAEALRALADRLAPEDVQLYYQIALLGRRDLALAPDPRSGLEMTVLRMLAFRPQAPGNTEVGAVPRERSEPRPARGSGPPPAARSRPEPAAPMVAGSRSPGPPAPGEVVDWRAVVGRLALSGITRELAMNAVFVGREGDTLTLRLDPSHAQMRGKAREAQLERALCDHFGAPICLVVEVGEAAGETPAHAARRLAEERREVAARALERDPTVQRLRDVFGATLVQESVRPEGDGDADP